MIQGKGVLHDKISLKNGFWPQFFAIFVGAYLTHYQNLLRINVGKTELEKTTEAMVEKHFKALSMRETESHRKETTKGIVKKAIKMMRNKRVPDRRGWRAEWINQSNAWDASLGEK